jgi:hypothetical protein
MSPEYVALIRLYPHFQPCECTYLVEGTLALETSYIPQQLIQTSYHLFYYYNKNERQLPHLIEWKPYDFHNYCCCWSCETLG